MKIIAFVIVAALIVLIVKFVSANRINYIADWAKANGTEVASTELYSFQNGPFKWYQCAAYTCCYEAKMVNGKTVWFNFGNLTTNVIEM